MSGADGDAYGAVPSLVDEDVRVAAFPDGSVDTYARVHDVDGRWLPTAAFRERSRNARSREFRLHRRTVDAGGQAVNAAQQAHALGDSVRLDGCLDDDRLAFPFETHSFGEPTRVDVHEFADADLTYADVSDDVSGWTHEAFDSIPDADAYVCGNWASVEGMTDSLRALAGDLEGAVFVFDPGDWTAAPTADVRECCSALASLDESVDVAVSVNGRELDALADALDVDDDPAAIREAAAVSAVVRHEEAAAAGAIRETERTVGNLDPDDVARRTGGGDRFSAGLAHGLATSDDFGAALALGNCCASYYVATGETGSGEQLIEFVDEHDIS